MKCLFCPEQKIIEVDVSTHNWECFGCQTIYAITQYIKLGDIEMMPRISWYQFSVDYKGSYIQFDFYLPDVDRKEFVMSDGNGKSILELNYLPTNLTPFNAIDKLPTLLTFS